MGQFSYRNEGFRDKYRGYQDRARADANDPGRQRAERTQRLMQLVGAVAPAAGTGIGALVGGLVGGGAGAVPGAAIGGALGGAGGQLAQGYGQMQAEPYEKRDMERASREEELMRLLASARR